MSRIDSIQINNFKFFDEQEPIMLGGKHLLLFGENGSGKSSVYWSLYTLFEASVKNDSEDIKKYFKHSDTHNESLINIYANEVNIVDVPTHYDSYIKVITTDRTPKIYEVSLLNTNINTNIEAKEINQASDFLNYKVLYKFQDFWNGQPIDLANIFEGYILPYIMFPEFGIWREGILKQITSAIEMWKEIKIGPGTTTNIKEKTIQVYKYSKENKQFELFAKHFEDNLKGIIEFVNVNAPAMLKKLGYDIDFELSYHEHTHKKADSRYTYTNFKIDLKITSYLGKQVNIYRPQSFLNEAKITAIAIAIRLTILKKRINEEAPDILKFIVFDDVMISLDMNNRDKLIDFILNIENKFTEDYQLFFLTHDKNLFDFITHKITQWDRLDNWVFKEMYTGIDKDSQKEYPIIIDSTLEFIEKAQKYFIARDYTTCSLYIRKELEKIVNERLPSELKYKTDGSFLSLQTLWTAMVARYQALNNPISDELKKNFTETKLMVLNPQAHFQHISMPIYKVEIEKAFDLIEKLKAFYPIPQHTLLLTKGTKLQFNHPSINYSFDFELLSDFYIDELNGIKRTVYPKCRVVKWQFNNIDFWDFSSGLVFGKEKIIAIEKRDDKLNKVIQNLKMEASLAITNDIFKRNTKIVNGIWTLNEIIDKAGILI